MINGAQRPAVSRRRPGAVLADDFITRQVLLQVILQKPGLCPQASQTQPRNEEGLASDRAESANLLAERRGNRCWVKLIHIF